MIGGAGRVYNGWWCCAKCGIIKNEKNAERACKGVVKVALRAAPAGDAVKALREAIEFADQDAQALTPVGKAMVDRWRAAIHTDLPNYAGWRSIDTAPEDCRVILAAVASTPPNLSGEQNAMTPKEAYEARKAERAARQNLGWRDQEQRDAADFLDLADRFVTAVERIADALASPAKQEG